MPLSISNSNNAPHDSRGLCLILALGLFALELIGLELFWRHHGHHPSVVDDKALWAFHRNRVHALDEKTIVLLGRSRMQLGFSTIRFRQRFPDYEVVQLAMDSKFPGATLHDLSLDEEFTGIIIYAADGLSLRRDKPFGMQREQDDYLDYFYNQYTLDKQLNRMISGWLQERLVAIHPYVGGKKIAEMLLRGSGLPDPYFLVTGFDRSGVADYTMLNIEAYRKNKIKVIETFLGEAKPQNIENWLSDVDTIDTEVTRIQERGGHVVFVRLPITGESQANYERHYPKHNYWDVFAKRTSGVAIHYTDLPGVADLHCPDTSHLDQRDQIFFTDALLDELVLRGVFK